MDHWVLQWMTTLKTEKRICEKLHRDRFSCRPEALPYTWAPSCGAVNKTKWAKTAQGRNHFWPSCVLGQREGLGLGEQSRVAHWKPRQEFQQTLQDVPLTQIQVQQTGLTRAWLALILTVESGEDGESVTHPLQSGSLDKEINSLALAQGMVEPAGCSLQCWAEEKALPGCKALLNHPQEVPDGDKTFVHRYSKVCKVFPALGSTCVILLSLVRMWCHIIAKKLASKSQGWLLSKKKEGKKNLILKPWLARVLSSLRICPEGVQVIVSWMH